MRFIATFIFLLLATTLCGTDVMAKYTGVVPIKPPQTPANSSVSITVNGTGAAALLYADNGTTRIANPVRADAYGAYQFEVATGVYDITMTRADGTTSTWTKVTIGLDATLIPWATPGTIGSTTPNTGAFTTLSATGQVTSTLATGTAPLVIASTTLVPNLYVARSALADVGTTVTTNHNMTGPITGTGNVTSITAQTGTGTTFVVQTSPTLITPLLGTPTSGVLTNCTGTAAGLTAGLATDTVSKTGTGSTYATNTSPTLITPLLGTPTSGVLTNCTGTAAGLTAGTVTTNANLTGVITSVGNATSIASQTGTGTKFVVDTSPTLVTPTLGAATATSITSGSFTDSGLTSGRITTAGAAGILQDFAGLIVVGTPNATAPSTGTNGPGLKNGIVVQGADGTFNASNLVAFDNGGTGQSGFNGIVCGGTAASPGATSSGDGTIWNLMGHDGTNFTTQGASITMLAASLWSNTSHETNIQFKVTPSGSTTLAAAGRIDSNATLVWGSNSNSSGTFSAGTLRPHIQTASTAAANAGIAQTMWNASATGPTGILAKSRSGTVGTQGVITTGDNLGTISWQGDDGTNFIQAGFISMSAEGTIGTGQIPGRFKLGTANSAGTTTTALQVDSQQVVMVSGTTVSGQSVFTGGTITPRLQVLGQTASSASSSVAAFLNSAVGANLYLAKSRSGTTGTMTVVNASDALGTIDFQGADGTNFVSGAQIVATTTGTPASTRIGGQLQFKTGTDAAPTVMTTAMTLTNTQVVQENGTTEASAVGTANVVNSGGLGVAKRSFLGTIGSTFKGNVDAGVQDATAAAAGQVGEVISASVTSYTNYTSTATIQNLTSISLTAGDWMEYATVTFYGNSATNATDGEFVSYLDDTTASATGAVEGETLVYQDEPTTGTLHRTVTISFHENIGASKTKYLNGKAAFTVGNPQYTCSLKAVRIR